MGDDHKRFADEKLQEFYQDFVNLREEFKEERAERAELKDALKENSALIQDIHESTLGLVDAWNNSLGFMRVVAAISKAVKILAPVGAVIWGLWYYLGHGTWPK